MTIKITQGTIVPLMLSEDQVSFIIAGLKDCADQLEATKDEQRCPEDQRDYEEMIQRNRELAELIEEDMNARFSDDTAYLEDCRDTVRDCLAAMDIY